MMHMYMHLCVSMKLVIIVQIRAWTLVQHQAIGLNQCWLTINHTLRNKLEILIKIQFFFKKFISKYLLQNIGDFVNYFFIRISISVGQIGKLFISAQLHASVLFKDLETTEIRPLI